MLLFSEYTDKPHNFTNYSEICCIALRVMQTSKGFGGFSVPSIILKKAGLMQITMYCSPSLAENDSRLLKNSEGNRDGEWIFCRRREATVALFVQVTRIRKIWKIFEANLTSRLLSETGWSQSNEPWNTKETKRIEIYQSRITNHDLLNSCR